MNPFDYQTEAIRTESVPDLQVFKNRIDVQVMRMLHSAIGLGTESGEFLDVLKRYLYYGQPLDEEKLINVMEELGDHLWYVAVGCEALGIDMGDVMSKNIAKLRKRFPHKFNEHEALNRNLVSENEALKD